MFYMHARISLYSDMPIFLYFYVLILKEKKMYILQSTFNLLFTHACMQAYMFQHVQSDSLIVLPDTTWPSLKISLVSPNPTLNFEVG